MRDVFAVHYGFMGRNLKKRVRNNGWLSSIHNGDGISGEITKNIWLFHQVESSSFNI
jgi:hypothetical protein